jgi:hypothetical protein
MYPGDEIGHVGYHHWRSMCRVMMFDHPSSPAYQVEFVDGLRTLPGEGWYRRLDPDGNLIAYVRVSDDGPAAGISRATPPPDVAPEDITDEVVQPVTIDESPIWAALCQLAEQVSKDAHQLPALQTRIAETMASIEDCWRKGSTGGKQTVDAIFFASDAVMRAALLDPMRSAETVTHVPLGELISAYLRCDIPGDWAGRALWECLVHEQRFFGRQNESALPELYAATIDQLTDVVDSCVEERDNFDVSTYFDLTYLAALYARTARNFIGAAPPGWLDPSVEQALPQRDRYLDERRVHDIAGPLQLAGVRWPHEAVEYVRGQAEYLGVSFADEARRKGLHPALLQVAEQADDSVSPEELTDRFQLAARDLPARDLDSDFVTSLSPIPPAQISVVDGFLAMSG